LLGFCLPCDVSEERGARLSVHLFPDSSFASTAISIRAKQTIPAGVAPLLAGTGHLGKQVTRYGSLRLQQHHGKKKRGVRKKTVPELRTAWDGTERCAGKQGSRPKIDGLPIWRKITGFLQPLARE